ncbi:MAG: hypothetical protein WCK02_03835 [Bacteroidota bacterium]
MIDNKTVAAISVALTKDSENKKIAAAIALAINHNCKVDPKIVAAITISLYPFINSQDVHDFQSPILTIKRIDRPYTPWSSKIYQLRQIPTKLNRSYK